MTASHTSFKLWVGILVAAPTAIPVVPLTSKLGNLAGNTSGSSSESSKLRDISTVSFSKSATIKSDILDNFASV